MRRNLHAVRGGRVVDELRVLGAQALQAALHHVVAVQVLDQRHHTCMGLLWGAGHKGQLGPGQPTTATERLWVPW